MIFDPPTNLPTILHTAEQLRRLDRYAIDQLGIPGYTLMNRAGTSAFRVLQRRWPQASRIVVVCGSGNNAGDGYVLGRLALQSGISVTLVSLFDAADLRSDAKTAHNDFVTAGGTISAPGESITHDTDVIVDAIFGIGLSRPLDPKVIACVNQLNDSNLPILALDIPTGLHADTGRILGAAVNASCTVTFLGLKLGFYLGEAKDCIGELEFDSLEVAAPATQTAVAAIRLDDRWLRSVLPARSQLSHKGSNGHVLIVGGNTGMAGAVRLAGEACLRVGAGLVTVATRSANTSFIVVERPELIVRGIETAADLQPLLARADVVAIGPGLGQDEWAQALFNAASASGKPMIVDADALNLLAQRPQHATNWILTPHPGEAGRLLGTTSAVVQADRIDAATKLVSRYGGVVVLKGANSIVMRHEHPPAICDRGNPAMATPGMGDVLAGVIAGLLAQCREDFFSTTCMGVVAHAVAGDRSALRLGSVERGLIASDLFLELPACVST